MSAEAAKIMGRGFFQTVGQDDLLPEFQPVLDSGWTVVNGAILLKGWYESYFGERSRFLETIDYEVSVNGRGIPDLDLAEAREARVPMLLRRGVAFAWAALHVQRSQLPDAKMAAYISAAPTLVDPDYFTGNVTFCAQRPGQLPYIEPERLTEEIVAALFTEDCEKPLSVS
ncbi:hypothetical protein ACIG87_27450 [Micromonospora sp. NPDC051925]|uniref:hypothetical protein n=1 Tax=Micromonospora sp. NPDC051925 TaxID=3364288 RepID=UPI0037CBCB7D